MQQLDSGMQRGRAPDVASHTAADRLALAMQLHKDICERNKAAWDLPLAQQAKELHALTLLSDKLDTMTAMLNSQEAADWHMMVDHAPDVYYINVHTGASQWPPPIVEGGFNLVPLHQTKERSGTGSLNEERAGGNSATQTYDSDKKCKVATPTASELMVQAAQLHEEINERISAVSHMDPGAQAKEVLAIQEMVDKWAAAHWQRRSHWHSPVSHHNITVTVTLKNYDKHSTHTAAAATRARAQWATAKCDCKKFLLDLNEV